MYSEEMAGSEWKIDGEGLGKDQVQTLTRVTQGVLACCDKTPSDGLT